MPTIAQARAPQRGAGLSLSVVEFKLFIARNFTNLYTLDGTATIQTFSWFLAAIF